jgi:hypothetical protein
MTRAGSEKTRPTTIAPPVPSRGRILKATLLALVVAAVVLVTAVLPAEYGIDPLGTGAAMGLTGMTGAAPAPPIVPAAGGPLTTRQLPYKVDAIELTIPPKRFLEYKYQLAEGATMLYVWRATGPLDIDFHTEPAGKPPEASDSFERGQATGGRGAYRAPYSGIHGWYWENKGDQPVKVTLQTAGFYSQARLFSDDGSSKPLPVKDLPPLTVPAAE